MKLFQNLFGKGGIEIAAPVSGKLVAISEVNDPTFGDEILGKGVAVIPSDNRICAPADGTVSTVFPTGHAAAITADSGAEILIHIGVDTVSLKGEGFTALVKSGDTVKKGTELIRFEREALEAKGFCMEVMQIVMDGEKSSGVQYHTGMDAQAGETVVAVWQ